jgi:hypothetical protein
MKIGDSITIQATVLRVDGEKLHAQTANGQLIQTDVSNCMKDEKEPTAIKQPEKPKTPEKKSVPAGENKRDPRGYENKSGSK